MANLKIQATLDIGAHGVYPFEIEVPVPAESVKVHPMKEVEIDLTVNGSGVNISAVAFGFLNVHKQILDNQPHQFHSGAGSVSLFGSAQIVP